MFCFPFQAKLDFLSETDNILGECFKFVINMYGCLSKVNT